MRQETRFKFNAYLSRVAELNGIDPDDVSKKFSVEPSVTQTMMNTVQMSSAFLQKINIVPVDELKGEKIGVGVNGTIASTTDTNSGKERKTADFTALESNKYECDQVNFDFHFKYKKLDLWARFQDFQRRIRDAIIQRQALDFIMAGFNGVERAETSDRTAHPMLQDVAVGWPQKYRNEAPTRVMSKIVDEEGNVVSAVIRVGKNGDYVNLDALVMDATDNLIDEIYQEDSELVAIVGRKLLADKYFPIVNKDQPNSEALAADIIISQKRIGNLPAVRVPYFPANAIMVTRLDNGIACPEMHLSNIVICAAPTAIFSPGKLPRRATYSGGDGLNWITEQMAADITKEKSFWNDLPNLFTDSQLKNTAAGQAVPGWDNSAKAVLKRGYMTLEQPPAGTVSAVGPSLLPGFEVSVSRFPSGRFSAAVDIIEKTGDQGVNSSGQNNLRVRIWAKDASGKLINTAWAGVSGNDDAAFATGPQYYTRYVPREDITSRTRLVIAENIPVPAEAVALVFNIRAEGTTGAPCPQMYMTNFVLRNGADCTWCAEAQSGQASSALSEVFMSPGGSDANTGVSASSPMKTLAAAIAKINGVGSVYVAAGDYSLADFQADFSAVRNVAIIGVTTAAFKYPTIRGGVKLTGISKVSGYNQIYSAPLTGFASGTHPSWLWIDNLPDEDTRETAEHYHPVMRGRAHRMECTKIWLANTVRDAINRDTPVAWSKSDALTEIDGSTQPRCVWVESEGVVYFTFPDGGDPLTSGLDVYAAPTVQGIFRGSETQFSAKGHAIVTGLHLRYARLGTWGFRQSVISDITVLGAAENCFDIGNWTTAYNCKAAGSGSRNFVGTYDGFNMHNFSVFTHYTCWAVAVVAAIVAGALLIRKYWEPISAFFGGVIEGVRAAFAPVAELFTPLKPMFDWLGGKLQAAWDWFNNLIAPVKSSQETLNSFRDAGVLFGQRLADALMLPLTAFNKLRNGIDWVLEKLGIINKESSTLDQTAAKANAATQGSSYIPATGTYGGYQAYKPVTAPAGRSYIDQSKNEYHIAVQGGGGGTQLDRQLQDALEKYEREKRARQRASMNHDG